MNGTIIRTILVIATSLNTALLATDITGFSSPMLDMVYKVASVVLNFIIVACATYYNNDYTEEAKVFISSKHRKVVTAMGASKIMLALSLARIL